MTNVPPALVVERLRYRRPGSDGSGHAVEVDELSLRSGEVLGLVGPSGCGKSTLIDLFALLRRPTSVQGFKLHGEDVAALWQRGNVDRCTALRAARIGVVLQTGGLLPSLTVRENVLLGQRLLGKLDIAWTHALLAKLDLTSLAARRPAQLSIGQRQRVAIARALAHRPSLVLADEPTASLGVDHAPAAIQLLLSLARDSGCALVVVSHDIALLRAHGVPLRHCVSRSGAIALEAAA